LLWTQHGARSAFVNIGLRLVLGLPGVWFGSVIGYAATQLYRSRPCAELESNWAIGEECSGSPSHRKIRKNFGMSRADFPDRIGFGRGKACSRVRAEKRKGFRLTEILPKKLKLHSRSLISSRPKPGNHLSECPYPSTVSTRSDDDLANDAPEKIVVG